MRFVFALALAACTQPEPNFADAGMNDAAVRDGGNDAGTDAFVPDLDAGPDAGPIVCRRGFEECSGDPCDTYTWADEAHCGECSTVCDPARLCIADACRLPLLAEVAAGWDHTCVRTGAGHVLCWGRNDDGELGDGIEETIPNDVDRADAVAVLDLADAVDLVSHQSASCVIRGAERAVSCWGDEGSDRFGDPDLPSDGDHEVPAPLVGVRDVLQVALGGVLQLCVRTPSEILCTGSNANGALGLADSGIRTRIPMVMPGLPSTETPVDVATGGPSATGHTCVVMTDGLVYCTGSNNDGQCGRDPADATALMGVMPVPGLSDVVDVEAGGAFTCALDASGGVWCWGDNDSGQLGRPPVGFDATPTLVPGIPPMRAIIAGPFFVLAISTDEAIWTWGNNSYGQLGRGTTAEIVAPAELMRMSGVTYQVAAGSNHACILATRGVETELSCAGNNDHFALGGVIGKRSSTFEPVPAVVP